MTTQTEMDLGTEEQGPQLSTAEKMTEIDVQLIEVLEEIYDKCHEVQARSNLDVSEFSGKFHHFVKLHNEQDKLIELADSEALDEVVKEYAAHIEPCFGVYYKQAASVLKKRPTAVMVKISQGENGIVLDLTPKYVEIVPVTPAETAPAPAA